MHVDIPHRHTKFQCKRVNSSRDIGDITLKIHITITLETFDRFDPLTNLAVASRYASHPKVLSRWFSMFSSYRGNGRPSGRTESIFTILHYSMLFLRTFAQKHLTWHIFPQFLRKLRSNEIEIWHTSSEWRLQGTCRISLKYDEYLPKTKIFPTKIHFY